MITRNPAYFSFTGAVIALLFFPAFVEAQAINDRLSASVIVEALLDPNVRVVLAVDRRDAFSESPFSSEGDAADYLLTKILLAVVKAETMLKGSPVSTYLYVIPPRPGVHYVESKAGDRRILSFRRDSARYLLFLGPGSDTDFPDAPLAKAHVSQLKGKGVFTADNYFSVYAKLGREAGFKIAEGNMVKSDELSPDFIDDLRAIIPVLRDGVLLGSLKPNVKTVLAETVIEGLLDALPSSGQNAQTSGETNAYSTQNQALPQDAQTDEKVDISDPPHYTYSKRFFRYYPNRKTP